VDCSGMVSLTEKNNVLLLPRRRKNIPDVFIINFSDSKIERKRKLEKLAGK
jgi:hypothetical protein